MSLSPRAKRRSPQAVHREILATADRLFYEQGYAATGINQIIAEAGVAKATFYGHFRSKESLGLAYLKQRHERWMVRLEEATASATSPRRTVEAAFVFLEHWLPEVEFRGCAFLNLLGEGTLPASLGQQVLDHKNQLRAFFVRIARSLRSGRAAKALADHLLLLFEGAIIECQVHHDAWPAAAAKRAAGQAMMG